MAYVTISIKASHELRSPVAAEQTLTVELMTSEVSSSAILGGSFVLLPDISLALRKVATQIDSLLLETPTGRTAILATIR